MYNSDIRVKNAFVKPEHTTHKSQCYYRLSNNYFGGKFPEVRELHQDLWGKKGPP